MSMQQLEINPPIKRFVVFSGGGGLITREAIIQLEKGGNKVTIREVPASFDPETFIVNIDKKDVTLREFVIKKPNRQYVDDNLKREGACAQRLIDSSVEIGTKRPEIIDICEAVKLRTYLDEEVFLVLWFDAKKKTETALAISYFIDDTRFKWKPTVIVELDENWKSAHIKGFIAITNESARRFDDVEVRFADFAKEMSEDAMNIRLEPNQFKELATKQRMQVMML